MPNYSRKSQSYKKSKNSKNSKSGGRRRKHTMRKYRRGRKVMRGGEDRTDVLIRYGLTPYSTQDEIDREDKKYNGKLKIDLSNAS